MRLVEALAVLLSKFSERREFFLEAQTTIGYASVMSSTPLNEEHAVNVGE